MNGQPIPGYFWDTEKKKYFRIQNQTAAQGANFKYTATNIKKTERKERIQNVALARSKKVRKERVVRCNPNTFAQSNLEREIGLGRISRHLHGLWPNACAARLDSVPREVLDSRRDYNHGIGFFDRDPNQPKIYAVHKTNSVCVQLADNYDASRHQRRSPLFKETYSDYAWSEVTRTTSKVSSLSFLPQTGALAVTSYGSDRPPELWLSDPDRDSPYVGQKFTPKDCPTIWGAAARPSTFTPSPGLANTVAATWSEHLAVAASNSMLLFTRSQDRAWNSQTPVKSLDTDILGLEWISYTTVALGCRNGNIRLYDTRSGGSSHILTHPTPVSKLKRADDETRLICSGLEDTLFLYDLRAPRLSRSSSKQTFNYDNHHYNEEYFKRIYPTHRDGKKRRKLNHKAFKNWSQPVLTFEHANREYLELAIDVHPRLGLLAAAQDATTDTAIRISNIWTGRTVKEIKNEDSCPHSIKSLKFIDRYDDVDDGADLWSCWKGGLAKFGWGHGYGEKRPPVCTD